MSFFDWDVCTGPDGTLHKVCLNRTTNRLRIDSGPEIGFVFPAQSVRLAVRGDGVCFSLTINGGEIATGGGDVWLCNWQYGYTDRIAKSTGAYAMAFRTLPTGDLEIYIQRDTSGFLSVFDLSGNFLRLSAAPYTAQAPIHHVDMDGTPVMGSDPGLNRTVRGIPLSGISESGGWTLGGGDVGNNEPAIIRIAPDGTPLEFVYNSQVPWRLAAGTHPQTGLPDVWSAIGGEGSPGPDAVPFATHRPLNPIPVPLPTLPAVPTVMPSIWIGLCTTFIGPGNCSWGNPIP